jgi:hypothetical protein
MYNLKLSSLMLAGCFAISLGLNSTLLARGDFGGGGAGGGFRGGGGLSEEQRINTERAYNSRDDRWQENNNFGTPGYDSGAYNSGQFTTTPTQAENTFNEEFPVDDY